MQVVLVCLDHVWGQLQFLLMVLGTVEALVGSMDSYVDPAASRSIARSRDRLGRAGFTRESADTRQFEVSQGTRLPSAASSLQVGLPAEYREGCL